MISPHAPVFGFGWWQVGLMASFTAGVIQLLLVPFSDFIASKIPRVALLSGLSGLGIVYLALRFCSEVRVSRDWSRGPRCLSPW
jgi:xanthine/uracil/vitamin C permease (AzgA family)